MAQLIGVLVVFAFAFMLLAFLWLYVVPLLFLAGTVTLLRFATLKAGVTRRNAFIAAAVLAVVSVSTFNTRHPTG